MLITRQCETTYPAAEYESGFKLHHMRTAFHGIVSICLWIFTVKEKLEELFVCYKLSF